MIIQFLKKISFCEIIEMTSNEIREKIANLWNDVIMREVEEMSDMRMVPNNISYASKSYAYL